MRRGKGILRIRMIDYLMTKYISRSNYDPFDVVAHIPYQKISPFSASALERLLDRKRIALTIGREKYGKIII